MLLRFAVAGECIHPRGEQQGHSYGGFGNAMKLLVRHPGCLAGQKRLIMQEDLLFD